MSKIRDFISRVNRHALAGALCISAGICFIFLPGVFLEVTFRIVGGALALAAALRFAYAIKAYNGHLMAAAVINSAFLFLVGLVMLASPGGTLGFIYVAIGLYLTINAFTHIYRAALAPKHKKSLSWWTEILTSSLFLVLGLWLTFASGTAQRLTEVIAGISLVIKGTLLFGRAYSERKLRKSRKGSDIEADFVDKSHEL